VGVYLQGVVSFFPLQVGCSIKDIYHERAWVDTDIASVRVKCIVETSDRSHGEERSTRGAYLENAVGECVD
jgi:hypothetical protein